jgi:hypothetical protein
MAMSYSAQGSLTVKRLRNGDTIFITLENNGKPLYQGINPTTGAVTPDWAVAANQPVITPVINTTRGNPVVMTAQVWKYNGVQLNFNGDETEGWKNDSTGKFSIYVSTGALKIIGNLASDINIANDTLTYSCVATVAGVEYNVSKSLDIRIQYVGATSYYGYLTASTEQLTAAVTEATLNTSLFLNAYEITEYYVKWYKDSELLPDMNGLKSITVDRDDVGGTQLFIAEFYKESTDVTPLFRAGIRIIDTQDEFQINCYIPASSTYKEVDTGKDVTVAAQLVNMRTNAVVTPEGATWQMDVMDPLTWTSLKTAATNTIVVTTTETDAGGVQRDVEVTAEVSWS